LGCVGSDRVGWCRRLGSTARCQQSPCTMFASGQMQNLHPQERHRINHFRYKLGCVGSDRVGWCRRLGSTARCQQSPCTMFASRRKQNLHPQERHRINHFRYKLGCVGSERVGWCRRLGSTARCQQSPCIYDVCPDAKSASARASSRQPSQVEEVGLCRLRSSRLVSTARVHGLVSAITMYDVCGRMQNLHPQERHRVNHSRSYKLGCVSNHHVRCGRMQNLHPQERHRVNHSRSYKLGCVGSDRVGWCRRLGSTAWCQQSPCTMFASGRMQHLHPQERQ
jgi:hypothetical protein